MTIKRVEKIMNGGIVQDFLIYECEYCGDDIPESWRKYSEDSNKFHPECAYLISKISEEKLISTEGFCTHVHVKSDQRIIYCHLVSCDQPINKYKQRAREYRRNKERYWDILCNNREKKCSNCQKKHNLTIDHIKPLSRGGTNEIKNLQILCNKCNCKKGKKTEEEWKKLKDT